MSQTSTSETNSTAVASAPRCNVAHWIKEQIDHCRQAVTDVHPDFKREVEWAQLSLLLQRELCQHEGRCRDCDPMLLNQV